MPYLEALGFHVVGYGCTTCIGNSGPLPEHVADAVTEGDLVVAAVLSGNRNFEGRINPHVRMNYLASPPLVVAYALAGDDGHRPRQRAARRIDRNGKPVYLKDIWPTDEEIRDAIRSRGEAGAVPQPVRARASRATSAGSSCQVGQGSTFEWDPKSTYVRKPPFFEDIPKEPAPLAGHQGRAGAGAARRLGDHRPHLARGQHRQDEPGGEVPDGAGRGAEGLQLLRRAPRQPRGDGARHVRQHPPQEPAGARRRGRRHGAHPHRRADVASTTRR